MFHRIETPHYILFTNLILHLENLARCVYFPMAQLILKIYVRSQKITTSCVDIDSVGHQYANPLRTGALDRMGSEELFLNQEQTLFRRRTFYIPGKELTEVYIREKTPEA